MVNDTTIKKGYKQTEVGVIPEDWEVTKIGNILKVIGGGAFKSIDSKDIGVRWLKIANVGINQILWEDESYLPVSFIHEYKNFLLNKGDYVIALTRPILDRRLKIARLRKHDVPALLNQRVGKIQTEKNYNADLSYYVLQKYEIINGLLQSMAGSDPPNLSNKGIYNIDIAVPCNEAEQTAIATVLSDTDALIENLEKLIAKKKAIKQGTMQQLLAGKKRLPGFEKKHGYKQTEVGMIPEDWDVKKLGEIADIDPDNLSSSTNTEYRFKYISLEDVDYGILRNITEIVFKNAPSRARRKVKKGDVLVATVRPNLKSHLVILKKVSDWVCSTGFSVLRCKENVAQSVFVFNHLFASIINKQIENIITGSNYPSINNREVRALQIPFPSLPEQTAIAQILSDMDAETESLQQKCHKYKQIKQGMMQQLLTGKIRLL